MTWNEEASRFLSLDDSGRERWLAELLYHLSMMARGTYDPESDGVEDAVRLRRFNELLHRVASQLRAHYNDYPGMPDQVFAIAITDGLKNLGVARPASFLVS